MHVVLDARTATDHFPGIGRYVVNLAKALKRIAPDLPLSLFHEPSAKGGRLALPNLPLNPCSVSPFSIRQQWILPRQLREKQATLYHSPYYLMPYRPGIPTVVTFYDMIPLVHPKFFSPSQRLLFRGTHLLASRAATCIIAVSEATRADLIRHIRVPREKIVVIPLGVDGHFHPRGREEIIQVRRKYGLPENYLLYVGTNKPHKNLERLVDAIRRMETTLPSHVKLVIAGPWDRRYDGAKKVANAAGLKDRVQFVGRIDEADLPALYSCALLFVFPSLREGFGLPVLEAMACGTPVVCSNGSALSEVAGEAAYLINPEDTHHLADGIDRVLGDEDLRHELAERGLKRAKLFTWEKTAEKTLTLYDHVLNRIR